MLKGRLGIDTARIPHVDRHGLMWLGRGNLFVEAGTLRFVTAGYGDLPSGNYAIPFQLVSCMIMQPGTTVSHDALRIMARHSTTVIFTGENGIRFYSALAFGAKSSARARRQVVLWSNHEQRERIVREMYAIRLGEILPATDINALRGIEGARMKTTYQQIALKYGVRWQGRRYDRNNPDSADIPNQAINHAASAVEGAALTAVAATGVIPSLGFIHEDASIAFALDISDLYRDSVLLPIAFSSAKVVLDGKKESLEIVVRRNAGKIFNNDKIVSRMIDRIKDLIDDSSDN